MELSVVNIIYLSYESKMRSLSPFITNEHYVAPLSKVMKYVECPADPLIQYIK